MQKRNMKVVFSGGGSMGHVTPNLLIIRELKEECEKNNLQCEVHYIGRSDDMERSAVESYSVPFYAIAAGRFRRYLHWRHLVDPLLVLVGFFQSLYLLWKLRPAVVFLKGGFVTVPVALAARLLKIPMIAHESDSVVGLANKIVSYLGATLALGFPLDVYSEVPKNSFFSGNPIRIELTQNIVSRETLDHQYGFYRNRPLILIMGGSQGSQRINVLVEALLLRLLEKYIVVHSTGQMGYEKFEHIREHMLPAHRDNYYVAPYIHETLGNFLAHADLVISRAGASSIFEILQFKKAAIIIPLSASVGGMQQIKNATFLKKYHLASVIEEGYLDTEKLFEEIEFILNDRAQRKEIVADISQLVPENSAQLLARKIISLA